MIPDFLLETSGPVDSLTLEYAPFSRRGVAWKEGERRFTARYSWNADGLLVSREEEGAAYLYAYDDHGRQAALYRMDSSGNVSSREIWEWDDSGRLNRRVIKSTESTAEEVWSYEQDETGRMMAERRGNRVRVEKKDRSGRLEQEYLYDGERPDLVTEYFYDESGHLTSILVGNPDGNRHRRTLYSYDENGRVASEVVYDSDNRVIRDELYAYGAAHGDRWLERVTWIPDGRRGKKRRPKEVVYRSFTFGGDDSRAAAAVHRTLAFANGVYSGPVLGDRPEGTGVFQYNDESRYEGDFRNGIMEGFGRLTWQDGRMMEGDFRRGVLEGKALCVWPDGSRYDGGFRNGLMDGPGIFTWADGTRFEGLFDKGRRTDQGVWERPGDK